MSFFQIDYEAPNIESSIPSLADAVASVSNALVHLDEYKNGIDIKKLQFLKDIWGGVGRMRMNMDKDKKREQARVDSAVIITGRRRCRRLTQRCLHVSSTSHTTNIHSASRNGRNLQICNIGECWVLLTSPSRY